MSRPLFLLEPTDAVRWSPFLGARPIGELRAGTWRIRERWEAALGAPVAGHIGATALGFHELDEPPASGGVTAGAPGAVVVRSDFAPQLARVELPVHARRLESAGITVGWLVPPGAAWVPDDEGPAVEIPGLLLRGAFDLVTAVEHFLAGDCVARAPGAGAAPAGSIVLGDSTCVHCDGATIEPGVVFDTRGGTIVVERGATVLSGTRIEGPCWIGPGARVLGGVIRSSALGPRSTVRGEVSSTVFLGYANKAHDGFVGHSVLGHWVNLGAGTTTSNLKNTYGPVRLSVAGTGIDTGRQFLGTLFGDHAKTAIGTMLPTGTVVGAGANVFGPAGGKYVPPFAWGTAGESMTEEGFLQVAARVLPRRDVEVTPARRESLAAIYRRLAPGRAQQGTGTRAP